MSYIFSSNGNEYTFKKMDNMLINLPDKDGKHILIRSSKDGDTKYSWETVNLIVNVNDIKATAYNPYQLTKVKGQTIYFDVSKGMNIVTIHAVLYNMNDNFLFHNNYFSVCNPLSKVPYFLHCKNTINKPPTANVINPIEYNLFFGKMSPSLPKKGRNTVRTSIYASITH